MSICCARLCATSGPKGLSLSMPPSCCDHLHVVWTLPSGDADYSGRWRAIKARFTRALARSGVPLAKDARGEYDLGQRRFWEHLIREDFAATLRTSTTIR
jgi:REP element-mobilizing transposase RayT